MASSIRGPAAAPLSGLFPKSRIAIALMFLMNGFVIGSWAPKIPDFAARLGLSESQLGLMILVFGVGSLTMMPLAGTQIARFGSAPVTRAVAIGLTPMLLFVTLANEVWLGVIAVFLLGGFAGAMDVAMNANAVEVEKSMRRAIMSSCHAFWSIGGLFGAGLGGLLIADYGVLTHAIALTVAAAAMVAIASPILLRDAPHAAGKKQKLRLPASPLPWLIGFMALFCMMPEGAILDWGALYLRQELGASVAQSGFAFAAFSLTMAIMRFAGDLIRDRLGAVRTMRVSAILAIIGILMAGRAPSVEVVMIGFAIAGLGIANLVPIAFSAAGNLPGMPPGVGISLVTTLGYSGMLFTPSLIGFVAEHTGFATVFTLLPVLPVIALLLSHLARHADGIK